MCHYLNFTGKEAEAHKGAKTRWQSAQQTTAEPST